MTQHVIVCFFSCSLMPTWKEPSPIRDITRESWPEVLPALAIGFEDASPIAGGRGLCPEVFG
jgi:hypothetical protein